MKILLQFQTLLLPIFLQLLSYIKLAIQFDVCEYKICLCSQKIISCDSSTNLAAIPLGIPRGSSDLMINSVRFSNPFISSSNMTGIQHLETLKIISSNLRIIKPNTFQYFRKLRYLDLSKNQLIQIQAGTFNALVLNVMHLEKNPGIQLNKESFRGLKTKSLNLKYNDLKKLDYETFEDLDLEELDVGHNYIKNIDSRFKKIFDKPPKIFDLTGNPLNCSCTISWLRNLVISSEAKVRNVKIICSEPTHLEGRNLANTLPEDVACPQPHIKSIFIDLQPTAARLICTAVGQQSPNLRWTYTEGKRNIIFETLTGQSDQPGKSDVVMNVTLTPEKKVYTCSAWADEETRQQTVVVNLRGPSRPYEPLSNIPIKSNTQVYEVPDDQRPASAQTDLLYEKQFNLLQMLGAVFGTFFCTSIVLGIIHYCVFYAKRRKALKKTYWSTHGSAYSATGSHEYDVPRIDPPALPPPPPMSMYPRTNEIEFLDFKTQTKLYR